MNRREAAAAGGGAEWYRYPEGSDSPAPPPLRDVRAPRLRAKHSEGRASGGLLCPPARVRLPTALAQWGGPGRCAQAQSQRRAHFEPGQFSPSGADGRELGAAPPGEAGAGWEGRRGAAGVWRRHRRLRAEEAVRSPRGHRWPGEPPTLLRRRKSLEPGRSGAGASPSATFCAVWGRKCRRRSPGRFSSTPLRMAPPSTGPALQSEWSRLGVAGAPAGLLALCGGRRPASLR